MTRRRVVCVWAAWVVVLAACAASRATPFDFCGTYIQGLEGCVLFQPDGGGAAVIPSVLRAVGMRARVQGEQVVCVGFCFAPCVVGAVVTDCAPACRADFNGSGQVTVQDIFGFLAAWFGQVTGPSPPGGDFDGSGTISVQDLFTFLAAWFAGCP